MNAFTLGLIVIAYLLSLVYFGLLGYKKTASTSDYLVGGRQMNPFVMAFSCGTTFISALVIVSFGGVTVVFGMGIQQLCFLNTSIGVVIAFIFFGLRTRRVGTRLNINTLPQLLGRYYRPRGIQVFVATVIFLGIPLYTTAVMKGGTVFIEQISQTDFDVSLLTFTLVIAAYVIAGSMKGAIYTNALQAVIIFGCVLSLLFSLYRVLDTGFTKASQMPTDIVSSIPEKFKALGHQGWTATPVTGLPQWCTLVTPLTLGVGIDYLTQLQLVVCFTTVESSKQLSRGVSIGCLFLITTVGTIYYIGALSNPFFLETEGVVTAEAVRDTDKIIPYFIDKATSDWFAAFPMLCILSASISTLSSQFHVVDASVGSDIYGIYKPRSCGKLTNVARLGVLSPVLIGYIICYMLPDDIIVRGTPIFMDICAAAFLPTYFCALYRKCATRRGVVASFWIGIIGNLFTLAFSHQKEAATMGTRRRLLGKDVLIEAHPFPTIDSTLFVLPLLTAAITIISLLTGKGKRQKCVVRSL